MRHFKIDEASIFGADCEYYIKATEHGTNKTYFFKKGNFMEKVIFKGDQTVWEIVSVDQDRITAKNALGSMIEANKDFFLPYSGLDDKE